MVPCYKASNRKPLKFVFDEAGKTSCIDMVGALRLEK